MAALTSISGYGSMPVMTAATSMYRTVQMASDARMPNGTSRCGLMASSECVLIESKPMKAKNTIAAPSMMPEKP